MIDEDGCAKNDKDNARRALAIAQDMVGERRWLGTRVGPQRETLRGMQGGDVGGEGGATL